MSLYESFNFCEGVIGVAKIAFFLERLYGVWRNIFCRLFSRCLFFLRLRRKYSGENPRRNSVKSQVNSEEITVRKDVGKIMQNVGSRRLNLNRQN